MRLLAIDPGFAKSGQGCACALLDNGVSYAPARPPPCSLVRVWFERPEGFDRACSDDLDVVVVERPQADARSLAVPIQTLITLAWEGATLAALYAGRDSAELKAPSVSAWKGSEAKPLQHKRLWRILTESERAVLGGDDTAARISTACTKGALKRWAPGSYYPRAWLGHNLLDAVALGCKALGRLL